MNRLNFAVVTAVVSLAATTALAQKTTLPSVSGATLVLHLDADVGVSVSGNTVQTWADANANGISFSRANGDPALVSGAINGQSVIRFTAGNGYDRLIDPALGSSGLNAQLSGQQLTIFVVTQNMTSLNGVLDSNRGASSSLRYAFGTVQVPGNTNTSISADAAGSVSTFRLSLKDDPGTGPVTNVRAFESFLRSDTFAGQLDADYGSDATLPHGFGLVEIGTINNGTAGASNDLNGDIAEYIIYRGALSDSDRLAVEQSLAAAYIPEPAGLALSLLAAPLVARRRHVARRSLM
jgi:hypothetical protein